MKIIHISDLHHEKHSGCENLINKIISYYKESENKPIIVLSGDLVHSSLNKKKMTEIKNILLRLIKDGFELLICPGNHDLKIKGLLGNPQKNLIKFNKYFKSLLPRNSNYFGDEDNDLLDFPLIHRYDNHFFIGLNSLEKKAKLARGRLGKDQISELNESLKMIRSENDNAVIIVYLHHNPFYFPYKYDSLKLEKRRLFLDTIKGVNVLLFGHFHNNIRYIKEEKKHNIDCIHLTGYTSMGSMARWTEIDTTTFKAKNIED